MARHGTMDGYRRLPVTALSLLIVAAHTAQSHPQYLDDFPSGHNSYFTDTPRIGTGGAVGHTGDRSGARLNSFGEAYKRAGVSRAVSLSQSCTAKDFERVGLNHADDDDDDHHHHHGAIWTLKFCCGDPDRDGQPNGLELGDPCCRWKKGRQAANRTDISHPALASEKTHRMSCQEPRNICGPAPPAPPPYPPPSPPGPAPPGPRPRTCALCVADDMVWCYSDQKCWAHQDPGDHKNGTCPGTAHCAAKESCDCTSCSDTRCQGPPSPPGPPAPPGPPIGATCLKALNFECQKAKGEGLAQCLLCAGEHAFILKHEHCTEVDFKAYCGSSPSPTPTPPPPPPPPAPVIHCDPHAVPVERCPGGAPCPNCGAPVPPGCACPVAPTPPAPANVSWVTEPGHDCFAGHDSMGECSSVRARPPGSAS